MMFWLGMIAYLIISETAALLDTIPGTIAFVAALAVFLLAFGCLLCVLVRRQDRECRKMDSTGVIPSVRAGRLRRRYL